MDIEKNVENFIINATYGEVLNYKKGGKTPIVESYEENQWTYIIEIMILTIKSLKPNEKSDGNTIDLIRFNSELSLWTHYRHGLNKNLIHAIENRVSSEYFTEKDETVYARLCVIVLANQNWEAVKREVIKNVLYSSANAELILEAIMLARILFLIMCCEEIDYEEFLIDLKNEAINFSQTELDSYDKYFKISKLDYKKDYKIQFERVRINLISILNGINLNNDFDILNKSLEILKKSEDSIKATTDELIEDENSFFLMGLKGLIAGEVMSCEIKDLKFLKNLCAYLVKLRKGRITLESLDLKSSQNPDLFQYDKGESFFHPLLNKAKVIYKGERGQFIVSYIQTRTGIYRFVKTNKD